MHSSVLQYIMSYIANFFMTYQFPWDSGTWTIWSYIVFCFVWFVVWYFIWNLLCSFF